jgi:hypothetical protein
MKKEEKKNGGLHMQKPAADNQSDLGYGRAGTGRNLAGGTGETDGHDPSAGHGDAGKSPDGGLGGENGAGIMETDAEAGEDICEGGGELRSGAAESDGKGSPVPQWLVLADEMGKQVEKIKIRTGYNGPMNRDALIPYIGSCFNAAGLYLLEAGAATAILKEFCLHGEFMDEIKKTGVSYRTANRYMKAALRFGKSVRRDKFALMPKAQLEELLDLDEGYDEEIEEHGTIDGKPLDEYTKLPSNKLRNAVRNLNKKCKSLEDKCVEMNTELMDLRDENIKLKSGEIHSDWSEDSKKILIEIRSTQIHIDQMMGRLFELADLVQKLDESDYSTAQIHSRQALVDAAFDILNFARGFNDKAESIYPKLQPGICGPEGYGFGSQDADFEDLPGGKS